MLLSRSDVARAPPRPLNGFSLSALKRRLLITVLVVLALTLLVWRPWRWTFRYHFNFPLPPTARLVNYHHSWGLDSGDESEFAVTDDALRDAIINEWNLKPAAEPDDAVSFAKLGGGPPWWPGKKLDGFPERYGRKDEARTSYWSVWVDRENGKVYAEKGDW
jgi:hypothetical protein